MSVLFRHVSSLHILYGEPPVRKKFIINLVSGCNLEKMWWKFKENQSIFVVLKII